MARKKKTSLAAVDFYGALQRALDAAQRQLACADNGFADFVIKEFKVDAAVRLHTSALGVLQFELADEATSAHSVSRVTLTLAAVAKAGGEAIPRDLAQADATALSALTWLPPDLVRQLAHHEIRTVSEFLGLVADARLTAQIVPLLQSQPDAMQRWADRMRLLTLPEMTVAYVDVLGKYGIASVAALAELRDDAFANLQRKASANVPADLLVRWRDAAKTR